MTQRNRAAASEVEMGRLKNPILAKFGAEKVQEFRERLCKVCIFASRHGHPCNLLPITSDGKDCGYFAGSQPSQSGGTTNG